MRYLASRSKRRTSNRHSSIDRREVFRASAIGHCRAWSRGNLMLAYAGHTALDALIVDGIFDAASAARRGHCV